MRLGEDVPKREKILVSFICEDVSIEGLVRFVDALVLHHENEVVHVLNIASNMKGNLLVEVVAIK